jgi:hypothetical protein
MGVVLVHVHCLHHATGTRAHNLCCLLLLLLLLPLLLLLLLLLLLAPASCHCRRYRLVLLERVLQQLVALAFLARSAPATDWMQRMQLQSGSVTTLVLKTLM